MNTEDKIKWEDIKIDSLDIDLYIDDNIPTNAKFLIQKWRKYTESNKVKEPIPLFTTVSGKPIYSGQIYAYTPKETLSYVNVSDGHSTPQPKDSFLYFESDLLAKEYVLMNKPVLSLGDVLDNCKVLPNGEWKTLNYYDLKKLAKQKIDK